LAAEPEVVLPFDRVRHPRAKFGPSCGAPITGLSGLQPGCPEAV